PMPVSNTLLLERKQSLRKKIGIAFAKNPEITDEMMDFLETLVAQVSDEAQAAYVAQRIQNKHEIREELSKELVSKQDLLLAETRLQSEISQVETSLRSEIKQVRIEIRFYVALIILAMVILNPGTLQAIRELLPFLK
ncbi:MAG: hypothetical protein AABZ14_06250, partial [Candidatus Margulisiibacteriota bacterium]